MNGKIGLDTSYTYRDITIIPVYQSHITVYPGGGAGDKEPLGLLIHAGTSLRIVSFVGSYSWWNDLRDDYPVLQTLEPIIPEAPDK